MDESSSEDEEQHSDDGGYVKVKMFDFECKIFVQPVV